MALELISSFCCIFLLRVSYVSKKNLMMVNIHWSKRTTMFCIDQPSKNVRPTLQDAFHLHRWSSMSPRNLTKKHEDHQLPAEPISLNRLYEFFAFFPAKALSKFSPVPAVHQKLHLKDIKNERDLFDKRLHALILRGASFFHYSSQ